MFVVALLTLVSTVPSLMPCFETRVLLGYAILLGNYELVISMENCLVQQIRIRLQRIMQSFVVQRVVLD